MIVVTTPTGHIGSQVVKNLLAAGESVRVIARDPAKLAPEFQGKVEVVQGSIDDESVMNKALEGAESLFLVVPPSFTTTDSTEYYLQFTRPACRAVLAQGVKRVVAVSATGRGVPVEAGPVSSTFVKDAEIESTGVDYRALWCPGFLENLLGQTGAMKNQGMFFGTFPADFKTRLVATRDIALTGAKLLRDRSWTGQGGVAVLGPEDISFGEMAETLTDVLGKPIQYQRIPNEALRAQMIQRGASAEFTQGMLDMLDAKINGLDNVEPRTPENTTPTSFRQWAEEYLKPAVLGE